jgi:hypothetical protein
MYIAEDNRNKGKPAQCCIPAAAVTIAAQLLNPNHAVAGALPAYSCYA